MHSATAGRGACDPEYRTLSGRNPSNVMKLIVDRCIYNGWTIPEPVKVLQHWSTLYVKWHWFCAERLVLSGEGSLPRQWEERAKVEEGQRLAALRNPPPDFSAPIFQTGQFRFKVEYKTSDNVPHAVECRADSRDEMYQKAKPFRVRPSRVTQLED